MSPNKLGACDEKKTLKSRTARTTVALTRLKMNWIYRIMSLQSHMRLICSAVISIFLYACKIWTLFVELNI